MSDKKNKTRESMSLAAFAAQLPEATATVQDERRLVGEELRERVEELFGAVSPADLSGHRLSVAWRIVRALAAAQGHVDREAPLSAVPDRAWDEHRPGYIQGHAEGTPPQVLAADEACLPLHPGTILERQDGDSAQRFAQVAYMIASHLGVRRHREGRLGLDSLLSDLAELGSWPSRWQLIALEDALVLHTFTTATVTPDSTEEPGAEVASEAKAARTLREEFQLSRPEADSVLALARRRALESLPDNQDALRAMQLLALDDAARRCAQGMDLRSEAAFRRLYAQVSGVTRSDPENVVGEFLDVVRKVSAKRELAEPQQIRLSEPGGGREPLDVDPEDSEALSDFDREN